MFLSFDHGMRCISVFNCLWIVHIFNADIKSLESSAPLHGLLSSSCGVLKSPLDPKVILTDRRTGGQTDEQTTGRTPCLRKLDKRVDRLLTTLDPQEVGREAKDVGTRRLGFLCPEKIACLKKDLRIETLSLSSMASQHPPHCHQIYLHTSLE